MQLTASQHFKIQRNILEDTKFSLPTAHCPAPICKNGTRGETPALILGTLAGIKQTPNQLHSFEGQGQTRNPKGSKIIPLSPKKRRSWIMSDNTTT